MNIRDLKYLLAVAQYKHFGKAAQACFVSQPTLSAQVKKLEEELEVIIFERTNKSVFITTAGEVIIRQAKLIMNEVDRLYQLASNNQDPLAGRFDIGIIPTLGPYLLPHIIPKWKEALPNLEIHIHEDKTDTILASLKSGELDAIILALPVPDEACTTVTLFKEPFYVAMPSGHRLCAQSKVNAENLDNETLLLLADGHCLRDQALDVCHHVGINHETGLQATSLETLRQMVATGAGITLIPQLALPIHVANQEMIQVRAFSEPAPFRTVGILWREHSPRVNLCEKIAELSKIDPSLQ